MPPLVERDTNDRRVKSRPWLRDGVVPRVSPHYNEVESSRDVILPILLVLVLLVSAVVVFFIFRANEAPGSTVNTPPAFGASSSPVPILSIATVGPTATTAITRYKVQAGDTLSGIAAKYGITVASLMAANNLTSNLIRPGDELIIPSAR